MMIAAAFLFGAAFSAVAVPDRYGEALSQRFPAWAVMNRRSAYVALDIVVRPDGSMMYCKVARSEGSEKLAEQACSLVYNIRLIPAKGPDGTAIYGRTQLEIRFMSRGGREQQNVAEVRRRPDLTVDDPALTPVDGQKPRFQLAVLVKPDGTVGDCQPGSTLRLSSEVAPPPPANLVALACGQVMGSRRSRILSQQNSPETYVDVLDVDVE